MFWKKKKMIDVRKLHQQGRIRIPKNDESIPTNNEGFVEMGNSQENTTQTTTDSSSGFFGFMDNPTSTLSTMESSGEDLRKVSGQVSSLDNKLYKLEQRIELLERKLDVSG